MSISSEEASAKKSWILGIKYKDLYTQIYKQNLDMDRYSFT